MREGGGGREREGEREEGEREEGEREEGRRRREGGGERE